MAAATENVERDEAVTDEERDRQIDERLDKIEVPNGLVAGGGSLLVVHPQRESAEKVTDDESDKDESDDADKPAE